MLFSYNECVSRYGSQYQTEKRINDGVLFRVEPGIYSTDRYIPDEAVLSKKYPKAVLSGEYAFYYHNLSDVIPDIFTLMTAAKAPKINDSKVRQQYIRDDLLYLGAKQAEINGYTVTIYDKERMLIELLRNKNSIPYDYYKEILSNYRRIIYDLEIWRIQEYADLFPKSKLISKALSEEVF